MAADLQALREYVTAAPTGIQNRGDGTVLLQVTHSNLKAVFMELRFDMHTTIGSLKEKLMSHVGTNASAMSITLKTPEKEVMFPHLSDDNMLGFYSPYDGCILHITDNDPFSLSVQGGLEDVSKIEKYIISDEDYNKRENTYRKFKENKLKEDPNWSFYGEIAKRMGQEKKVVEKVTDDNYMYECTDGMEVGMRCEVSPGERRGWVRYIGKETGESKSNLPLGWWIGVEYDEPLGKNNGTVKGVKYFECADNFGAMIRPDKVKVGDYPNLADDIFGSDDEL